jgi:DNA polymerase-1
MQRLVKLGVLPARKKSATAVAEEPAVPAKPGASTEAIFLIDTMSFIFRAYHAMARQRGMSTKTGIPTSATYVFTNMLLKLVKDFHPAYRAAVFDVGAKTFRDDQAAQMSAISKFDLKTQSFQQQEYKGYKANRAEMPQDLAQQVPYIRRLLEAYRIPILGMENYEADDLIGTLARQAAEQGHKVYVVSSDKDMLQLVNDNIYVLNPPKDNLICDPAKVEEILGVPPRQVIDVMALRGDSIDNVPGAPGIGDKGSVEIIKRFGSVESALDHAGELEKKTYRESLQNNREQVLWSKKLVTIETNAPVTLDLEPMRAVEPDAEACRQLFTELEFTSLLKDFLPTGVELGETDYRETDSAQEIDGVVKGLATGGSLAVAVEISAGAAMDAEGEALEVADHGSLPLIPVAVGANQVGSAQKIALSAKEGQAISVPLSGDAGARVRSLLADRKISKSIHDWKSASHALTGGPGVPAGEFREIEGVEHDPMLYSFLLDPTYSNHDLPAVALRHFNLKLSGSLAEAADITGRLAASLRQKVEEAGLMSVYRDIDLPLVPVLARMEEAGVKIDCDVLYEMGRRLEREIDVKAREIYDKAGVEFNINSPKQLGDVLFNKLNLPKPVKYGKGKTISTAQDVLEGLAAEHEVPRLVLDYRQLAKLKSTYVDTLPALLNQGTLRLHTTFDQTNAVTGRLSSKNPNLQNIPVRTELGREIRAAFMAESGNVLLKADYSQIELRLMAHFSEDPLLTKAFLSAGDVHKATAAELFNVHVDLVTKEQRGAAKTVNFATIYGQREFSLGQQLGISITEAKKFIADYFAKYSGVRANIDRTLAEARRDGYVRTLFGRIRPLPDINGKNFNLRGFAERTAVNTPLQGTAADLIKLAMIRIDRELREQKLKSRMLLQVHDELVFEAPEKELTSLKKLVRDAMENVYKLKVPLVVDISVGKNWRDMA